MTEGGDSKPTADTQDGAEPIDGEATRMISDDELVEVSPAGVALPPAHIDPHAWFLGRSFGGFRIVCALAEGGMATVFLARKEGPLRVSKHAAIKVVHPHLAFEREFVDMFLDEARIAAAIHHPNVCAVLDFGQAEGTYYLAMEYLLGESWSTVRAALAEHPSGSRALPEITAYVLSQAAEGLYAAHEALDEQGHPLRVVHRDVSPQNIFVAYDGTVRLLDFGIARAADRITSTRAGTLKGRLAYMSPEQMSLGEVGPSADQWAIGVVLREALEGKRLFRRPTDAETMLAVTNDPLPEWSAEVPEALRAVADRALERDPAARYPNAHELALELARFAAQARRPVAASELSVWMGLLFAAQHEKKRALLQLPFPEPLAATDDAGQEISHAEPVAATSQWGEQPAQKPRASGGSRPAWLNVPALVALGSIGATFGLLLGRIAHPASRAAPHEPPSMDAAPGVQPRAAEPAPAPSAVPTVDPLTTPEAQGDRPPDASPAGESSDAPLEAHGSTENQLGHDAPPDPRGLPDRAEVPERPSTDAGSPAAPPPPGTLAVAYASGWAEVYLGQKLLGTTPGRFTLPAGPHILRIQPFGTGKAFKQRVEVRAGELTKLFLGAPPPLRRRDL